MHAPSSLLHLAASLGFLDLQGDESMVAVIAVTLSLAIPIVAIVMVFTHKLRKEQLWHETARLAIEKGQPIPARPLSADDDKAAVAPAGTNPAEWDRFNRAHRRRKDIRNGLILAGIGAGFYFSETGGRFGQAHGLVVFVPLFMGLGLFLNGLLDGLFSRKAGDSGDFPPRS
jgi:hypothetical protein